MNYLNSAVPYSILNLAGKNSAAPHAYTVNVPNKNKFNYSQTTANYLIIFRDN